MRSKQNAFYIQILVVLIFAYGCSSTTGPNDKQSCLESKVFFGLTIEDKLISETEWNNFLDSEIVTRFPEGFTIVNSEGFWRYCDTCQTSSEPSKILILIYPRSKRNENKVLIDIIAEKYKQIFRQQFVLTTTSETDCNLE